MFDDSSRYSDAYQYEAMDSRGRTVKVVSVPFPPVQDLLGIHLLRQGQRLDHLAYRYLNNGTGFWRISEMNNVMLPEALTERQEIAIPNKKYF